MLVPTLADTQEGASLELQSGLAPSPNATVLCTFVCRNQPDPFNTSEPFLLPHGVDETMDVSLVLKNGTGVVVDWINFSTA